MMLSLYRAVTTIGQPLIRFYLSRRLAKGKESRDRFSERLGVAGMARPEGALVWIHGASVGESISLLPVIERMRADWADWNILVTTGTITSAALMRERLPEGAFHQFVPVDRVAYVERFLKHWKPDFVLWAESEFWPNLISRCAARNLPMVLINGRISNNSYKGWRRFPGSIKKLLQAFSLCLGQTGTDADRLSDLGAHEAKSVGNLKFAAPPLPADDEALEKLSALIGGRPFWLASSTHAGEEELVGRVHLSLKESHPNLLSVIVPRHPGRGVAISIALKNMGLRVALRSTKGEITEDTDVYIADTVGELGLFYRLARIVFIGKSLVPLGGQNPLEAARLNCAVVFGPYMTNFEEITTTFKRKKACLEVANEKDLKDTVARLLGETNECNRLAEAAAAVAQDESGVLDAVMDELEPYLRSDR